MDNKPLHPESHMMTYGYIPALSEGAIKCPLFQTSTFVFRTAEEGKAYFELAYGLRNPNPEEELGLIYSRINNPNLEILEDRLGLWDEADDCAVFESGMSAISTVLLEFLTRGDILLYSNPVYGGTDHFIKHYLKNLGIESIGIHPGQSREEIMALLAGKEERVAMIYLETPANPTNDLFDIAMFSSIKAELAKRRTGENESTVMVVDNTYMGPIWQHPLKFGADLVVYSATKYIGGHSDLIAGAVLGSQPLLTRVKTTRTFLGNMVSPHTAWMLLRSLETLKVRMDQQTKNAQMLALHLSNHHMVEKIYFLGMMDDEANALFARQCEAPGAMLSFDIQGGEKEAFVFLNSLKLIKLAVSLGSTESLAEHPATMTHVGVDQELRELINITGKLVRLSVGVEHIDDLIADVDQAFDKVKEHRSLITLPSLPIVN